MRRTVDKLYPIVQDVSIGEAKRRLDQLAPPRTDRWIVAPPLGWPRLSTVCRPSPRRRAKTRVRAASDACASCRARSVSKDCGGAPISGPPPPPLTADWMPVASPPAEAAIPAINASVSSPMSYPPQRRPFNEFVIQRYKTILPATATYAPKAKNRRLHVIAVALLLVIRAVRLLLVGTTVRHASPSAVPRRRWRRLAFGSSPVDRWMT